MGHIRARARVLYELLGRLDICAVSEGLSLSSLNPRKASIQLIQRHAATCNDISRGLYATGYAGPMFWPHSRNASYLESR